MTTEDRCKEVVEYAIANGDAMACDVFDIKAQTLERYRHLMADVDIELPATLQKIKERYTDAELKALAKGGKLTAQQMRIPNVTFEGDSVKIGVITDTHIGSDCFHDHLLMQAFEQFDKFGVDMLVHAGDVTEGLSNRPGHVYECTEIGYDAQKEKAIDLLSRWAKPSYYIDGNHDRWYVKSSGAWIVKDICDALPNAEFLGSDEGDIYLNDTVKLRLWHGEDGSSYATSYRIQKLVEAFSGGDKPNILVCGHTHKQGQFFERNIHCIGGGSIQLQSKWMRSKRLAAHVGFWIIEPVIAEKSVPYITSTWFPFYL